MKLLAEVQEVEEFYRLKLLFEMNGILIHYGNEDTARNYSVFHPAGKYAFYVVLKEQYLDAILLMKDENHIVKKPINIEEYKKYSEKNTLRVNKNILECLFIALVIGFIFVAGLIWLIF